MPFILIDYSEACRASHSSAVASPQRGGKFIQIRNFDSEYLLLSPVELSAYHANIAERFFSEKGVKGSYNKKRDNFQIDDSEWEIVGGGVWTVDDREKTLRLSGRSLAYGEYDRRGMKERLFSTGRFPDYTITVE